jgi:(S)-ureidoglycine aminohydrolase
MNIFGSTRSRVCRDHALIASDSFVKSLQPGWEKTECIILISPHMGARFSQYLALMEPGGVASPALPGVERVIYVLEGRLTLKIPRNGEHILTSGGFAFFPPGAEIQVQAMTPLRLNVFEKPYVPLSGTAPPQFLFGQEQNVAGAPFMGDPGAVLKTLLPADFSFDMAVNIFTYSPGATLPMVEVHVMEHGLLMLQGQGVYRLADSWYPVREGDGIWMASYCPQWFVAMGTNPARYLYYKDVNRHPLHLEFKK